MGLNLKHYIGRLLWYLLLGFIGASGACVCFTVARFCERSIPFGFNLTNFVFCLFVDIPSFGYLISQSLKVLCAFWSLIAGNT